MKARSSKRPDVAGIAPRRTRAIGNALLLLPCGLLALLSAWPLLADVRTRTLAANTLCLSTSVALLSLIVGVPLAVLVARTDMPGRRLALGILTGLLLMPLFVQAAGWQAGFGLQGWYTNLGGRTLLEGWPAVIGIHTAAAIPWIVLITSVGLWRTEPELEELALLDSSPLAVIVGVTLRRNLGALATAGLWAALTTAGEMTVTNLFLVRTYAEEVYTQLAQGNEPDTAGWTLLPGVLGTAWLVLLGLLAAHWLADCGRYAAQRSPLQFRLGRWRPAATAVVCATIVVLAGVPLANLVHKAGLQVEHDARGWHRYWSAIQCLKMIADSPLRFRRELGWSLAIGSLAALAAVGAAIPLAWAARGRGWPAALAWCFTTCCFALPGPVIGLLVIWLFNAPGYRWLDYLYDRSIAAPCLAQTIRALPLATIVLWHACRSLPDQLIEVALLEGASRVSVIWRLVLPATWPTWMAAWLIALAACLGDLAAAILVVPPGMTTLAIQIFSLIHAGVDDQVAGICLALVAFYSAVALAVLWLLARGQPGR